MDVVTLLILKKATLQEPLSSESIEELKGDLELIKDVILVETELLDKRDAIRKEEILSAVVKSGRSYEEIMNFLNAGSDGEKTEK